ncbi:16987_t:CDS:2 [Racocetra persica]|uniref:16987_t:CDS:1 n=1 Tax=Racocetra persica TaxID=160502 RepID=A0ACA9LC80_9GLOM|nr:16987_t:CDS:2 [Racocetra persica]
MLKFKTLFDLLEAFPNEQGIINLLEQNRWNGKVVSPYDPASKAYKCANNQCRCQKKWQVLADGTRILSSRGTQDALKMVAGDSQQKRGPRLKEYLSQKSLQPFKAEARKNMDLSPRQAIIAAQGEILVRSFAKIGLIALVDEATGYQYEREKAELQAILKTYIAEEILEWQKTFQLDFYKEIFRL